jgi:hypothetical protein
LGRQEDHHRHHGVSEFAGACDTFGSPPKTMKGVLSASAAALARARNALGGSPGAASQRRPEKLAIGATPGSRPPRTTISIIPGADAFNRCSMPQADAQIVCSSGPMVFLSRLGACRYASLQLFYARPCCVFGRRLTRFMVGRPLYTSHVDCRHGKAGRPPSGVSGDNRNVIIYRGARHRSVAALQGCRPRRPPRRYLALRCLHSRPLRCWRRSAATPAELE